MLGKNSEQELALKEAKYQVEDILYKNKPVIYNGNVNTAEQRGQLNAFAEQQEVILVCVYVKTPLRIAKRRALTPRYDPTIKRWRIVTQRQFEEKVAELTEPKGTEVVCIYGTDLFNKQFKTLLDFVDKSSP